MRNPTSKPEARVASSPSLTLPGDLLTPDQAAEITNLDVTTIYAKLRAGEIPYYDLAKRARRIRRADLELFIQSRLRGGEAVLHTEATPTSSTPNLAEYWSRPTAAAGRQARNGAAR